MTPEEQSLLDDLVELDNRFDALPPPAVGAGATDPATAFHAALGAARLALMARLGVRHYATKTTLEADEARLAEVRAELGDPAFEEAFTPKPPTPELPVIEDELDEVDAHPDVEVDAEDRDFGPEPR